MKRAKQLFSILLVALMVFSLVPQAFSAGAAEEDAGTQLDQSQWQTNTDTWQAAGGGHYHQYTGYSVLREPTCSSYGEAYMYCAICGEPKTEAIAKLPHTWGEWEILLETTDHSAGFREHTCQVCGTVEQEAFDPEGTLRPGDHGDAVEELQHLLVENGNLDHHHITRDYDWMTEQAVKTAEKDAGMDQDAIAWPKLINHLRHDFGPWVYTVLPSYETAGHRERTCSKCGFVEKVDTGKKLERGAYGDDVLRLQERLTELGFSIGKPDGSFGRRTEDAIKGFQGIIGRPVDGIVWPGIWEILFPDEEMQFARDRDKPTGIAGIFIPGSWERPAISTPDFVRAENNEEQVTEDKPALAVEIKVSNTPSACDYFCEGERVEYEITVTNTGNVPFNLIDFEVSFEAENAEEKTPAYSVAQLLGLAPGETKTCSEFYDEAYYVHEDQKTATTTVVAKTTVSSFDEDISASDSVTYPVGPNPARVTLTIDSVEAPEKEGIYREGDEIVLQATITNDGTVPLTHVNLSTQFYTCITNTFSFDLDLAPGESKTDSYAVTITRECEELLERLQNNSAFLELFGPASFTVHGYYTFDYQGKELYFQHDEPVLLP